MRKFNRKPDELSLDELIESLAHYDNGHLSSWNLEARDLPGMIRACCEEMDNLVYRAEVIGWCMTLNGEAIGEDFFQGVGLLSEEILHRTRIIQAIIRKALAEMEVRP